MWQQHRSERSEESVLDDRPGWEHKVKSLQNLMKHFAFRCLEKFCSYSFKGSEEQRNTGMIHKGANPPWTQRSLYKNDHDDGYANNENNENKKFNL